jgi:pyruvate formate lyase activating enzyme
MDRRAFLRRLAALGVAVPCLRCRLDAATPRKAPARASYWHANPDTSVTCELCPHGETLKQGEAGKCRGRVNHDGILQTYATGQPCVLNVDPIEKNPLAHVLPGSEALAIAHAGCNLRCRYCQNWQFSQQSPAETRNLDFSRQEAFDLARRKSLVGITFTYTEATVHLEFSRTLAEEARAAGLRTFLCTAGWIEPEPWRDFLSVLDAVTVTIKGMRDSFYRDVVGAPSVRPVLAACEQAKAAGVWLEVATLIVPGLNDSDADLGAVAGWIARHLGDETPWHLERFSPKYKLADLPQTPVATLERARELGRTKGLRYVYISNVAPHEGNHTLCPRCGNALIKRLGFKVLSNTLKDGRCPRCQTPVPGLWK